MGVTAYFNGLMCSTWPHLKIPGRILLSDVRFSRDSRYKNEGENHEILEFRGWNRAFIRVPPVIAVLANVGWIGYLLVLDIISNLLKSLGLYLKRFRRGGPGKMAVQRISNFAQIGPFQPHFWTPGSDSFSVTFIFLNSPYLYLQHIKILGRWYFLFCHNLPLDFTKSEKWEN